MAGLFDSIGSGLKGLFGDGFADRAAIAGAMLEGDYSGAASIKAAQAKRAEDERKTQIQQQAMLRAYAYFKSQGMPDDAAITLASDPQTSAQFVSDSLKPHDYGPDGGSRLDPISHTYSSAPRWDSDNNYYAPNADASQAPQRIVKGIKPVVTQGYGSKVYGWDSQSPQGFVGGSSDAPESGPVHVSSKEEVDRLPPGTAFIAPDGSVRVKPGGPTGSPSGGFPY